MRKVHGRRTVGRTNTIDYADACVAHMDQTERKKERKEEKRKKERTHERKKEEKKERKKKIGKKERKEGNKKKKKGLTIKDERQRSHQSSAGRGGSTQKTYFRPTFFLFVTWMRSHEVRARDGG